MANPKAYSIFDRVSGETYRNLMIKCMRAQAALEALSEALDYADASDECIPNSDIAHILRIGGVMPTKDINNRLIEPVGGYR